MGYHDTHACPKAINGQSVIARLRSSSITSTKMDENPHTCGLHTRNTTRERPGTEKDGIDGKVKVVTLATQMKRQVAEP